MPKQEQNKALVLEESERGQPVPKDVLDEAEKESNKSDFIANDKNVEIISGQQDNTDVKRVT